MKRMYKTILVALFLVVSVLNAQSKEPDEAFQEGNYLLAMKLYKDKLYNAESVFLRTMALDGLDIVFSQMPPSQVIKEIEIIFTEYPYRDEVILSSYAEALMKQGDYVRAKKIIDEVLSTTQDREYAYERLVINGLEKRPKQNIEVKDAYPEFVEELYQKSLNYYASWKKTKKPYMYHKALFYIDSAITIEPNRDDLRFLKGMILSETKTQLQLELALTSFLQAIIIRPSNDPAQLMVAQTLFALGRYKEAIVRYKWIFKTYKKEAMDYMTLYPFAVSYLALGEKDSLLGYFKNELSKYDEYNKDMWFIRAVIYKDMGYKKEAIDVLQWLIDNSKKEKKKEYLKFLLAKYKGGKK